ncbi:MAG: copper resistance protein NlpE [Candidatus Kapaibacterium sp.]
MKIALTLLLLIMLLFSSSSIAKQSQDDSQNNLNSLDWVGTYIGTLPCDDCKEIQKRITLYEDMTYEIRTEYIGSKTPTDLIQNGVFEWSKDGSYITLKIDIPNLKPFKYKINENTLISLNIKSEVDENSVKYTKLTRIE